MTTFDGGQYRLIDGSGDGFFRIHDSQDLIQDQDGNEISKSQFIEKFPEFPEKILFLQDGQSLDGTQNVSQAFSGLGYVRTQNPVKASRGLKPGGGLVALVVVGGAVFVGWTLSRDQKAEPTPGLQAYVPGQDGAWVNFTVPPMFPGADDQELTESEVDPDLNPDLGLENDANTFVIYNVTQEDLAGDDDDAPEPAEGPSEGDAEEDAPLSDDEYLLQAYLSLVADTSMENYDRVVASLPEHLRTPFMKDIMKLFGGAFLARKLPFGGRIAGRLNRNNRLVRLAAEAEQARQLAAPSEPPEGFRKHMEHRLAGTDHAEAGEHSAAGDAFLEASNHEMLDDISWQIQMAEAALEQYMQMQDVVGMTKAWIRITELYVEVAQAEGDIDKVSDLISRLETNLNRITGEMLEVGMTAEVAAIAYHARRSFGIELERGTLTMWIQSPEFSAMPSSAQQAVIRANEIIEMDDAEEQRLAARAFLRDFIEAMYSDEVADHAGTRHGNTLPSTPFYIQIWLANLAHGPEGAFGMSLSTVVTVHEISQMGEGVDNSPMISELLRMAEDFMNRALEEDYTNAEAMQEALETTRHRVGLSLH